MIHRFRYLPALSASLFATAGGYKCHSISPSYSTSLPKCSVSVGTACRPKQPAQGGACGEDACVVVKGNDGSLVILAVADGVGGWRKKGIDPSLFSNALIQCLTDMATSKDSSPDPLQLMKGAFWRLVDRFTKKEWRPFGSATCCVAVINTASVDTELSVANLGDSGLMVIRDSKVVFRTDVQQAAFNTPFQLTLRPEGIASDTTAQAQVDTCKLEKGDVIVMGTDGLFDNVFPEDIIRVISGERKAASLAASLVSIARSNSIRIDYMSPFAVEAGNHGKFHVGGKPDDITVLVAILE